MQTMNEIKHRMNYGRERNHYTERPSDADVFSVDAGHIEEIGTLLRYRPSDVRRRGLPHWRGGLQPITAQHTHAPRVQKLRNASFLQNRREDTIQAERHADNA